MVTVAEESETAAAATAGMTAAVRIWPVCSSTSERTRT